MLAVAVVLSAVAGASELRHTAIVRAVARARPSIVNIHGQKAVVDEQYGGSSTRQVNGMGTGIVLDERGYILTNYHVINGVRIIQVTTCEKKTYIARLVSYDAKTDLAVIKIDAKESLPVIATGTSSDLMTGEPVIAVGNAYGYEHTVTRGIVSALGRTVQVSDTHRYDDLIQTDASINPGNSGGPLLNIDGEMIGLNVAVRAGAQGIGFAIPVDNTMAVAAKLLSSERVQNTWHGVVVEFAGSISPQGIVVSAIDRESPAARSGLKPGDVIKTVDNQQVVRAIDLERAMLGRRAGDRIEVAVERENEAMTVQLVLASISSRAAPAEDEIWTSLGLELEPVPAREFARQNSRYQGGLKVRAVRANGPAARQGVRTGDILVGMHGWATTSLDDVRYVLGHKDRASFSPVKFYILRDGSTLYGHLPLD